ncbi:hypothetical protein [Bacillus marasmi]|uniref:hypothetical protein n=1 Tax=Bacillus marasmi TaxID=1926279 RepID=UPI0011C9383F|nr:hypothetical protein [Bacillus marasmi]
MGIFDKLRDLKLDIEIKASDIRYAVSDKFDDVKYFVEDKVDDVKYFVEDKVDDVKYFVGDKVDDAKYFVADKVDDVKEFAGDKLKIKSKGDVAEIAANILFPAQIPIKMLMSSLGKNAAANIQDKNDLLLKHVQMLENLQIRGEKLEKEVQDNLSSIRLTKTELQSHLTIFADLFERIHNRPTYRIQYAGASFSLVELFDRSVQELDFARFDDYLINLYDEEAGILQGLLRTPVFAAILKFREKTLINKIDNVKYEVDNCIINLRSLVKYLTKLSSTSGNLAIELNAILDIFKNQLNKLSEIVGNKNDFSQFKEKEITVLDTNIKLVRIIVTLLNIHIFSKDEIDEKGFTKINTEEVEHSINESEKVRIAV